MKNKKVEQAYDEILKVIEKYKDICVFDITELRRKSKNHLFGLKLKEEFNLGIDPLIVYNSDWVVVDSYRFIGWWGSKYNRQISWSDDGRQPENELLLQICFPTGAYIFGDDYPQKLFQEFFLELKSYNPDYIDTHNSCLYFKVEKAAKVFNSFGLILEKYHKINKQDSKKRQIQKLEEELKKLQTTKHEE